MVRLFLSTTNLLDPPLDAILPEQNESTVYNSKNPTFRHPSASDVRPILQNPNALHYHYCSSLNVQSRRKHCAYGDKNHSKQEQLKKEIKEGVNSLHKSKKSRKKKKPEDIPVKCRFDFPKPNSSETQVYIQQVDSKDHDLKVRMKIASKRNDHWLNSHMRSIMEVSTGPRLTDEFSIVTSVSKIFF